VKNWPAQQKQLANWPDELNNQLALNESTILRHENTRPRYAYHGFKFDNFKMWITVVYFILSFENWFEKQRNGKRSTVPDPLRFGLSTFLAYFNWIKAYLFNLLLSPVKFHLSNDSFQKKNSSCLCTWYSPWLLVWSHGNDGFGSCLHYRGNLQRWRSVLGAACSFQLECTKFLTFVLCIYPWFRLICNSLQ